MVHHELLETPTHKAGSGVFTFYGSSTIRAPAKQIFDVLLDFPSYHKWNAYTPQITRPDNSPITNAVTDLKPNDMIQLQYRPEPTGKLMAVPCQVLEVNVSEKRICWRGRALGIPQVLLNPEKVQRVTELHGVDEGKCLYEVWETQGGPLAYAVKWTLGEKLSAMSRGMAEGLRAYLEDGKEVEQP